MLEKAEGNYSAYIPDLPGCVTVGDTIEEVKQNIQEATEVHLESLQEDGLLIPESTTECDYVEVGTVVG